MPKVSIIVPVYNVEEYLEECLDSICKQTYQNIEIICVNDGSTDGSADILEKYRSFDSRVTVITTPNQGLSLARNTGLDAATGKYIYFVDSDDYLVSDGIESMVHAAETQSLDVLAVGVDVLCDDPSLSNVFLEERNYFRIKNSYPDVSCGKVLMAKMYKNGDYRVAVYATFSRRELLVSKSIRFYPGIVHEDILYTYTLMV